MERLRQWWMDSGPPDRTPEEQYQEFFRGLRSRGERLRGMFGGGGSGSGNGSGGSLRFVRFLSLILLAGALVWLASGVYTVQPGEVGVVRQFGRISSQSGPGLHWHIPWPVEQVNTESVTRVRSMELGFRTQERGGIQPFPTESIMIASDEALVDLHLVIQYQVADPVKFLFFVKDPDGDPSQRTLRDATEAAIRQVVGLRPVDDVLTIAKAEVQNATQTLLQAILDRYDTGIVVRNVRLQDVQPPEQVQEAFKDVIAARVDQERFQEEAIAYQNDVIPRAQGRAVELVNQARAFEAERIAQAQGEADQFLAFLAGMGGVQGQDILVTYLGALEDARARLASATAELQPLGLSAEDDAKRTEAEAQAQAEQRAAREAFLDGISQVVTGQDYVAAREVTRQRIYLETMERLLPDIRKFILSSENSGNLLQFLPLQDQGTQTGETQ